MSASSWCSCCMLVPSGRQQYAAILVLLSPGRTWCHASSPAVGRNGTAHAWTAQCQPDDCDQSRASTVIASRMRASIGRRPRISLRAGRSRCCATGRSGPTTTGGRQSESGSRARAAMCGCSVSTRQASRRTRCRGSARSLAAEKSASVFSHWIDISPAATSAHRCRSSHERAEGPAVPVRAGRNPS